MYTIEIFLNDKPDTDKIKTIIEEGLGVMPAFYDHGTHIVVAHRFNLQMLEFLSNNLNVEKIRGMHLRGRVEALQSVLYLKGMTKFDY